MTHQYDDISVALHDHVAVVEIQRPPHNFFDVSLIRQIANAFDTLDDDPSCRAIVLASDGKSFCAGANFGSGGNDTSASAEFTEEGFMSTTGTLY
ncbi:MAG TPA: enoyl-CoA hydratase, partial [Gammaproteobacteria bacterium]|nr:enoyl-CoA hydratase [Gammaproteobacteria bacterium]